MPIPTSKAAPETPNRDCSSSKARSNSAERPCPPNVDRPGDPGPPPLEQRGLPAPATLDEGPVPADGEVARAPLAAARSPPASRMPSARKATSSCGLAQVHQLAPAGEPAARDAHRFVLAPAYGRRGQLRPSLALQLSKVYSRTVLIDGGSGMPDLSGKVAIVTGAASGIGKTTCETLARHGASVVVAGHSMAGADEVAADISGPGWNGHRRRGRRDRRGTGQGHGRRGSHRVRRARCAPQQCGRHEDAPGPRRRQRHHRGVGRDDGDQPARSLLRLQVRHPRDAEAGGGASSTPRPPPGSRPSGSAFPTESPRRRCTG